MSKKPSQILQEALDSFGLEGEHWTRGVLVKWYFLSKEGNVINTIYPPSDSSEPKNICFCSVGAIRNASDPDFLKHLDIPRENKVNYLLSMGYLRKTSEHSITHWNDNPYRKFCEVKEAFEKAIELAKQNND